MPKGSLNVEILPLRDETIPSCRYCKREIRFAKTPRGKTMAISREDNGPWTAHFVQCPNAHLSKK